jgi:hypothetical protein
MHKTTRRHSVTIAGKRQAYAKAASFLLLTKDLSRCLATGGYVRYFALSNPRDWTDAVRFSREKGAVRKITCYAQHNVYLDSTNKSHTISIDGYHYTDMCAHTLAESQMVVLLTGSNV